MKRDPRVPSRKGGSIRFIRHKAINFMGFFAMCDALSQVVTQSDPLEGRKVAYINIFVRITLAPHIPRRRPICYRLTTLRHFNAPSVIGKKTLEIIELCNLNLPMCRHSHIDMFCQSLRWVNSVLVLAVFYCPFQASWPHDHFS